jgi:hypothetical protein
MMCKSGIELVMWITCLLGWEEVSLALSRRLERVRWNGSGWGEFRFWFGLYG